MKKAICIGINDYPGTVNDLNGCVNDASDWTELLLLEYGFDPVELILDSQATKEKILTTLEDLIVNAQEGDVIVFTYSGHGTYVTDLNDDEEDYYDEALYVYDDIIVDDEFRNILDLTPEGVNVYLIMDSCFGGTMTRALLQEGTKPRYVEVENLLGKELKNRFLQEEEMKELLLTGSAEDEYSYDAYINGRYNGAMSYYAIKAIKEDTQAIWEDFYQRLRMDLPNSTFPQTPQLEGPQNKKEQTLFAEQSIEEELPEIKIPVYMIIVLAVIVGLIAYALAK
jgi:hypothetical protein